MDEGAREIAILKNELSLCDETLRTKDGQIESLIENRADLRAQLAATEQERDALEREVQEDARLHAETIVVNRQAVSVIEALTTERDGLREAVREANAIIRMPLGLERANMIDNWLALPSVQQAVGKEGKP